MTTRKKGLIYPKRLRFFKTIFDTFLYLFLYQSYPIYNLFSRFLALRNARAGPDVQYWDDSIRERLLRRRNKK